jgi:hypothetical protein
MANIFNPEPFYYTSFFVLKARKLPVSPCLALDLTRKMHLQNADVVEKFIFRYLSVPLTDGLSNILVNIKNKDIPNESSS